jgi:hypothetical protein
LAKEPVPCLREGEAEVNRTVEVEVLAVKLVTSQFPPTVKVPPGADRAAREVTSPATSKVPVTAEALTVPVPERLPANDTLLFPSVSAPELTVRFLRLVVVPTGPVTLADPAPKAKVASLVAADPFKAAVNEITPELVVKVLEALSVTLPEYVWLPVVVTLPTLKAATEAFVELRLRLVSGVVPPTSPFRVTVPVPALRVSVCAPSRAAKLTEPPPEEVQVVMLVGPVSSTAWEAVTVGEVPELKLTTVPWS